MYICVNTCVCVCISIHVCIYTYICTYVYTYICVCVYSMICSSSITCIYGVIRFGVLSTEKGGLRLVAQVGRGAGCLAPFMTPSTAPFMKWYSCLCLYVYVVIRIHIYICICIYLHFVHFYTVYMLFLYVCTYGTPNLQAGWDEATATCRRARYAGVASCPWDGSTDNSLATA